MGLVKLSIKLVPRIPQNRMTQALPNIRAYKYFFREILDNPAAKFTKNEGVKGIEIIKTNLVKDILSIICINFSRLDLLVINFLNRGLNPTLHRKNVKKLPKMVQIQEVKSPSIDPKERILIVIKATRGKNANIPSSSMKIQLKNGAHMPAFIRRVFMYSFILLKNSIISIYFSLSFIVWYFGKYICVNFVWKCIWLFYLSTV